MGNAGDPEPDRGNDHDVRQRRDLRVFLLKLGHSPLQIFDRRGVGAHAGIQLIRFARHEQEHRHPDVGDDDIDRDHRGKHVVAHVEYLLHRRLVRAPADPASGHGGQSTPHGLRPRATHRLRTDERHDEDGQGPAEDDPDGTGEEEDQGLRPESENRLQVDRQGQQDQSGGQQIPRGDEVQAGRLRVDDPERVVERRQEVTEEDDGDVAIELSPERMCARIRVEDGPQGRGQEAEHGGIVGQQGLRLLHGALHR